MRKLLLLATISAFAIGSCKKKGNYFRSDAKIIGYDYSKCNCCGGYMIEIVEDDSKPYFLSRTLPAENGINPSHPFPMEVEIDYTKDEKSCEEVITVTRLREK